MSHTVKQLFISAKLIEEFHGRNKQHQHSDKESRIGSIFNRRLISRIKENS